MFMFDRLFKLFKRERPSESKNEEERRCGQCGQCGHCAERVRNSAIRSAEIRKWQATPKYKRRYIKRISK